MLKVVFVTTLNAIRDKRPDKDEWNTLLAYLGKTTADDEPINLLTILESNGALFTLWALRAVEKHPEGDRVMRLMAADFAEIVLPDHENKCPGDDRPRKAIKAARDFANGKITEKERAVAGKEAGDAAWTTTSPAAGSAAWAASGDAVSPPGLPAAAYAAWVAAGDAAGDVYVKIIREYLTIDA